VAAALEEGGPAERAGRGESGGGKARKLKPQSQQADHLSNLYRSFYDRLPTILENILGDYVAYTSRLNIDDARSLAAGHLAGRAALLHIQEILRLAERFSALPRLPTMGDDDREAEELLRQVRQAIAATGANVDE
jgi:hypothetical protein